jgi:AcrR family transcriptional regulator
MARRLNDTRNRILRAAGELFSDAGIRAGGMDQIAERACVTKRTLYYHFRSKDDLIAAYMSELNGATLARLRAMMQGGGETLADRVSFLLSELARAAAAPRWRGCGFLSAAFEVGEMPGHPARRIAAAHKRAMEDWLTEEIRRESLACAEFRARCLMLLLDGTIAQLVVHKDAEYAATAAAMARSILAQTEDAAADRQCSTAAHRCGRRVGMRDIECGTRRERSEHCSSL